MKTITIIYLGFLLALMSCKKNKHNIVHVKGRVLDYVTREPIDSARVLLYFGFNAGASVGVLGTPNDKKSNYTEKIVYTNSKGEYDLSIEGEIAYGYIYARKEGYLSYENSYETKKGINYLEDNSPKIPIGTTENVELYMTPEVNVTLEFYSKKFKSNEIKYVDYFAYSYYTNGQAKVPNGSAMRKDSLPNSLLSPKEKAISDSKLDVEYSFSTNTGEGKRDTVTVQLSGKKDHYFVIDLDK